MKKFFAIALIAASFVACNEGEKKEETVTPNADSVAAAAADSAAKAAAAAIDTTAKAATAAIDSTVKAVKDSIKK
ncbi:MAG: hypothetical protein QM687_11145 [Ferruginibacter sp.]